jgi:predicted XRE-type DNA-binding protein
MKEKLDVVSGSGNVFRDLGLKDADREHLRAQLAARIIGILDDHKITVRKAQTLTGVSAANVSRIRQAKLDRFTIDRLMTILSSLGHSVDVSVKVPGPENCAPLCKGFRNKKSAPPERMRAANTPPSE